MALLGQQTQLQFHFSSQGHVVPGQAEPGKEGNLVVKLPYHDAGSTIVRAWIGTADRTKSLVGEGDCAPSQDDDVHAAAPDPLPDGVRGWVVELERPDGTRLVGSVEPLLD